VGREAAFITEEASMQSTEHKTFQAPDETREFPNGHAEILSFGGGEVGRLGELGWRWSKRRQADRQDGELPGASFPIPPQRALAIRMDDGTEFIAGPGDVTSLPSGHHAWVLGDEPVTVVDWFGASNYAKQS
jgi:hypothetical protein